MKTILVAPTGNPRLSKEVAQRRHFRRARQESETFVIGSAITMDRTAAISRRRNSMMAAIAEAQRRGTP
jgi:hypothetical protein